LLGYAVETKGRTFMNKILIANWKMQKTYSESMTWVNENAHELDALVNKYKNKLVLCPSFLPIDQIRNILANTTINLGAQDCSAYERGAFTGEVSVLSLKEIGCTYCIVGHSDRRQFHGETDDLVAQKAALLLTHGITPIVCVGESSRARQDKQTYVSLCKQLKPVLEAISCITTKAELYIAYEPLWAIGTGHVPTQQELQEISLWIKEILSSCLTIKTKILYGGSVDEQKMPDLNELPHVDGFLIGRASTKSEVLKKLLMDL
jgi:triosephosphate isomerase (TIM)